MKKTTFTKEQIAYTLHQAETGTPVADICRKLGISEQNFYPWKKKYAGMGVAELRRLKQLEEENHKLKQKLAPQKDLRSPSGDLDVQEESITGESARVSLVSSSNADLRPP